GVAPAFSTASAPLLIAATAEVVCGALTTAAVVPPIATSATVSAASPVNLLVGVPPIRRPNARSECRNPYLRNGRSTNRYDTAAAATDSTSASTPAPTGTPASGPKPCVA